MFYAFVKNAKKDFNFMELNTPLACVEFIFFYLYHFASKGQNIHLYI
jgi:hypothetical protein